ncbi:Ribosomal protein S3, mitochondrial, partial [Linum perenne]
MLSQPPKQPDSMRSGKIYNEERRPESMSIQGELIEKFRNLGGIGELKKGIEMMIEIILRNRRIPYGYSSYLNEMKKMRSLLSNR